jgi:PhzF family phenazine biosynthesis protein
MKIRLYQIDAFAERLFEGNPAAVCVLEEWPEERVMQQIAMENNLAETAYVVKNGAQYEIRWFTPELEVALCGHATLASAYVLFRYFEKEAKELSFYSHRSGPLAVAKGADGLLTLDFPSDPGSEAVADEALIEALGKAPIRSFRGKTDYLLLYERQADIEALQPDFFLLNKVDARGVIVSAPGEEVDFVSRFFAPQSGINEDPVTGSAHTTLTPYWSEKLGKKTLSARQLSKRGGKLSCEYLGNRVKISGRAVQYLVGEVEIG